MALLEYINKAVTPHHAVEVGAEFLLKKGFTELELGQAFSIHRGGRYFIKAYSTSLIVFTVGTEVKENQVFHTLILLVLQH